MKPEQKARRFRTKLLVDLIVDSPPETEQDWRDLEAGYLFIQEGYDPVKGAR
jgi:hypothetical protein